MSISLPQSTIDWIFYIINMVTFLFCGISIIFRQDFDGASNELVAAMLYEWDRKGKIPKKKWKRLKLFHIVRAVALTGLLIVIVLIIRKPTWILTIIEVGLIIQTIVILINCLTQPDHNFSKYEQYWIVWVAVFLVMQRFPLGLFSNDIVIWQSQLPEGLSVAVQSVLWLIQIFMLFTSMLLAFNGFCKWKKRIKRKRYR